MSKDLKAELKELKEKELLDFIRNTVNQLNMLGDRLEEYVAEIEQPVVGFDIELPDAPLDPEAGVILESPEVPGNDA